jgi:hypothetical protein
MIRRDSTKFVIAGLVPAIHVFKSWMPGTSPGMTVSLIQEA